MPHSSLVVIYTLGGAITTTAILIPHVFLTYLSIWLIYPPPPGYPSDHFYAARRGGRGLPFHRRAQGKVNPNPLNRRAPSQTLIRPPLLAPSLPPPCPSLSPQVIMVIILTLTLTIPNPNPP